MITHFIQVEPNDSNCMFTTPIVNIHKYLMDEVGDIIDVKRVHSTETEFKVQYTFNGTDICLVFGVLVVEGLWCLVLEFEDEYHNDRVKEILKENVIEEPMLN